MSQGKAPLSILPPFPQMLQHTYPLQGGKGTFTYGQEAYSDCFRIK